MQRFFCYSVGACKHTVITAARLLFIYSIYVILDSSPTLNITSKTSRTLCQAIISIRAHSVFFTECSL